jgi:hypothetical protein
MHRTGWIVIDTIGKMHAHRQTLFAFCADCAALYRKDRMDQSPPSSWTVDLAALIAERGADSPSVRMAPVPCPYCSGLNVSFRKAGPGPNQPMIAYVGARRETEVAVLTADLGCGAGIVPCFECKGRGVWDYMEPEIPAAPCVTCKGTGKVLVAV